MKNNPYVGPRPYERIDQDNFYGRKRESRDLLSLILAERVVLFYAPSGAGKTSLLNAQVIPALEADDFRVLPATRVGSDLPPGINSQDVENIFVFSALMGLAEDQVPVETLTGHTLLSFLHELCPKDDPDDNPPILVLDQFEEILTTHRDRWQDARGFFEQMREALRGMPSLGVVFSMREDYVAGMDPYASLLPRRLRARFRMERLDRRGALEAMKKPAQNAGCPFDPGVAERLVDDLRRIKTVQNSAQQPDDQTTVLGPFIEPVQLQVVCNRLWENLPEQEDNAIQWEEVEEFGNVDRALTDFYENALVQCVEETGVSERQLRSWFGEHLITPMQTRGLALRGEHETNGLPNEAVDVLSNRHLIRADMRAGARWYELSHDRLVDPILASNTAWDIARETPLRMTAKRWQETKDEDLVYRDKTLAEALIWSQNHPDEVEPYELEFLEVSQKVQRGRNRARWLRTLVIILLAIGIVATAWSAYVAQKAENTAIAAQEEAEIKRQEAEQAQAEAETERQAAQASAELAVAKAAEAEAQRLEAERQQQIALAQSLAALAPYTNNDDELTILLAIESLNVTGDSPGPAGWLIDHALRDVLTKPYFNNTLSGHEDDVRSVAFSADGRWLASGSAGELSNSGTVRVWDMNDLSSPPRVLSGHEDWVTSVAFSADGRWLASGSDDCTVRVWDMNDLAAAPRVLSGHEYGVMSVAFSPDGRWLASGSDDRMMRVWDMNDLSSPPRVLIGHEEGVTSVAFSADGRWLASGSYDRTVRVWDMNDLSSPPRVLSGHEDTVRSVAFSADGRWLASGSHDHTVRVWDMNNLAAAPRVLSGHEDEVRSVAFSADGRWLASGSAGEMSNSGTVRVWNMNGLSSPPRVLIGHEYGVWSVAFSADGRWLALANDDHTVRVWDMNDLSSPPRVLSGHEDWVRSVAFSPDGRWLASGGSDRTVRVWDMNDLSSPPRVLSGHEDTVRSVAFSADGRWLASGSDDRAVRVWDMNDLSSPPRVLSGHESWVSAVAFSPDGRWLASGSYDRTLRVWDMNDLAVAPRVLNGHEAVVFSVAFSPDGRWLASGSGDYTARVWIATLEELAEIGCQRVYRNMTHEEWNRYLPGEPYRVTCPNRPVPED